MKTPNVIMIITDQQRFDTIRSAGQKYACTPNLDRLASEGILFSRAYCTTPMCSPARASILSGLYPHSHGMVANHQARPGPNRIHLPDKVKLLADYMKPVGYRTAYVGKWHLGTGSNRRGFADLVVRFGDGEGDTSAPSDNDYVNYAKKIGMKVGRKKLGNDPDPELYNCRLLCGPSLAPLAYHASAFTCRRVEDFLLGSVGIDDPFLLVYSCIEPHPPFVCPEPFYSMYNPDDVYMPSNWTDEKEQQCLKRADWQLRSARDFTEKDLRKMWAHYLGTVSYIDYLVGRMLSILADIEKLDETLFIFTSDHGEMLGSHGLLLKGASFYEELIHVPLIIRPPRNLHNGGRYSGSCDSLISHVDLVPTILSYCGLNIPEGLEGVDFSHLLRGASGDVRDAVAAEFHSSNWTDPVSPLRMWRTRSWKYVESREGDHELYDLEKDPEEITNLADHVEYMNIQRIMADELHSWCRSTGDSWPKVLLPTREDLKEAKKQNIDPARRGL